MYQPQAAPVRRGPQAVLDLSHLASPLRLDAPVRDRRAWTRDTLHPADWTVTLGADVRDELASGAPVRAEPAPQLMIS